MKVAQPAVNNTCGTAGSTGREIVLLQQERASSCSNTLAGDGDTIDAPADYHHFEMLVCQRRPTRRSCTHVVFDAAGGLGGSRGVRLSKCLRVI